MNNLVKKGLNLIGIGTGSIYINDIKIDYTFFTPTTLESEITEEKIDGSEGKVITTHVENTNVEITIDGSFTSILFEQQDIFQKLLELRTNKELIKLTGTEYDELDFVIQSITKKDEGINYIDFEVNLKQVEFVIVKEFEFDETVMGRAEFKKESKKTKGKVKEETAKSYEEESYSI